MQSKLLQTLEEKGIKLGRGDKKFSGKVTRFIVLHIMTNHSPVPNFVDRKNTLHVEVSFAALVRFVIDISYQRRERQIRLVASTATKTRNDESVGTILDLEALIVDELTRMQDGWRQSILEAWANPPLLTQLLIDQK